MRRAGTIATSVALLLLTLVGFAIRVDRIRGAEGRIDEDEARLVLAAKGVLATGLPTMPSGKRYFRGVVNTYLTALSVGLLGMSDFAARFPNTVVGALLIPVLFLFGRRLGGTTAGLGAAALAATQPELIAWSARAWMTSLFIVVFVAAAYLLWLGFERDQPRMQIAGAVMGLIAMLAHELGVLLPAALALTLLIRAVGRDFRWFAGTRTLVAMAVLLLGVLFFVALGLQLRAATLAGPGGEFRFYFGPSLSPKRFLLDYQRWRSGYALLLVGAILGLPFLRRPGVRFLYLTIAVTGFVVWVVIQKESERYGLLLLPLTFMAGSWGIAQSVTYVGSRVGLRDRATHRLVAVVFVIALGVPLARDAASAAGRWSQPATRTWLTEFRELGPSPDDPIMSGAPEIPALYLGRADYWERGGNYERYGYRDGDTIRHLYTGALRVADLDDFRAVLRTDTPRTLWYVGRSGALTLGDALLQSAELVHQTSGEEIILKIPLGPTRAPGPP